MNSTNKNKICIWLKKQWSNILFFVVVVLLIIPQTRLPIQIKLNQLIAFSPSELAKDKQLKLESYHWQLENREGQLINFSRSKGKVILVNYWATWCGPCIAEMPSLQNLHARFGTEVDFYFITSDTPQKVDTFFETHDYLLPSYQMRSAPPLQLESSSLPTTYLIDKMGQLKMYKVGAANWDSKLVHQTIQSLLKV